MKSPAKRHHGFTLLELLVVIGIIGVLVSILIPTVGMLRRRAYATATQAQISALMSAIEAYRSDFNAYPGPLPVEQIYGGTSPFVNDSSGNPWAITPKNLGSWNFKPLKISGAQNLTLGLLGGLGVDTSAGTVYSFDPTRIMPDLTTQATNAQGPSELGLSNARRHAAYITPQTGDLSRVTGSASCADANNNSPDDTCIPVFVDKFPDAMPILYMRARRSADGLVAQAGLDGAGNSISAQYDIREIASYTTSPAFVNKSVAPNGHGLQKLWSGSATYSGAIDAWPYLRNPDIGPPIPASGNPNWNGAPRQKDGYILISAGVDRTYGTVDDLTNFGPVAP